MIRPLIATVLLCVILFTTYRLSQWQFSRAAQKTELIKQKTEKLNLPALTNDTIFEHPPDELRFRQGQLQGAFVDDDTILIDNKIHEKTAGFHVLTPLRLRDNDTHVMVNRGWIRAPGDRSIPTDPPPAPAGIVSVDGVFVTDDADHFSLSEENYSSSIWQNFNLRAFAQTRTLTLFPYVLLATATLQADIVTQQPFYEKITPEKNISYGWQWRIFGALALVFYLGYLYRRRAQ